MPSVEALLEMYLYDEIQKELNRDIIAHLTTGSPLESTLATFESDEAREQWCENQRLLKERVEQTRRTEHDQLTGWENGYPGDCKSPYPSSNLGPVSSF